MQAKSPTTQRTHPRRRTTEIRRPDLRRQDPAGFDKAYWVDQSQGYRVDGVGGRIGFVDQVRHQNGIAVLAVRAGLLGRHSFLFPASDVAFIVPREKQIHLASSAIPIATERAVDVAVA